MVFLLDKKMRILRRRTTCHITQVRQFTVMLPQILITLPLLFNGTDGMSLTTSKHLNSIFPLAWTEPNRTHFAQPWSKAVSKCTCLCLLPSHLWPWQRTASPYKTLTVSQSWCPLETRYAFKYLFNWSKRTIFLSSPVPSFGRAGTFMLF